MSNSKATVRDRIPLFAAIFVLLTAPLFIKDPLLTTKMLVGTGIVAAAVVVVVTRFRRYADRLIPTRWMEHRSATVRVVTRVVRVYGLYVVGFYTVIAMLLLFQAIGRFV